MKKTTILLTTILSMASMANTFIGKQSYSHTFENRDIEFTTTNSYTSYNYGEPTIRLHESLDQIVLKGDMASSLFHSMKGFYASKKVGNGYQAVLDTNFFMIEKDMIVIECLSTRKCTISYDQKKKSEILTGSNYPKYQAGLVGDFFNMRGVTTIAGADTKLKNLNDGSYKAHSVLFSELSKEGKYTLSMSNGSLAKLLNTAGICEELSVPSCGTYCSGNRNRNRDTRFVGNCMITLNGIQSIAL